MSTTTRANLPQLLFSCAQQIGLQPTWLDQAGLFVIATPAGERYINYSISQLNSQLNASLSRNKYSTRLILDRHKLPSIPYTLATSQAQAAAFLARHGKIIAVHRSEYGVSVEETRELQRISYPISEWQPELSGLSLKVANIMGLRFAAVDYLIDSSGKARILEVNSSPGMKWFHAPSSGPPVDLARMFLQAILADD